MDVKNEDLYDSFRDSISTVDEKGKRVWIYPKKPKGSFHNYRLITSIILLIFLFSAPFIKIGGEPFLLFNVIKREFYIFGSYFGPQDFFIFCLVMLCGLVSVVLFTVVYGRIFCGWVCPQTIFMEMVFRKIEFLFEGDYVKQRNFNKGHWTIDKIVRKVAKHAIFLFVAFLISNTFLSYIIGIEELYKYVQDGPFEHATTFTIIGFFSLAFYGVFAFLREQVCIMACPYGRLQGVMIDPNSIVIHYDFVRGEPRGKLTKQIAKDEEKKGDCINCNQCVAVCPTGIDIRNGTQLECVNCTACIDACDEIMDKVNKPRGLIRYASFNSITKGEKLKLSSRIIAYSAVLIILLSVTSYTMFNRSTIDGNILRSAGSIYTTQKDQSITNIYNFQLINKTSDERNLEMILRQPNGKIKVAAKDTIPHFTLKDKQTLDGVMLITIPPESLKSMKTPLVIDIIEDGKTLKTINTNFLGPVK